MILDTNAVSALSFMDAGIFELLGSTTQHHLPVIVIGEYEFGISGSSQRKGLAVWFDLFISENVVLPADLDTAREYAAICASLKRAGTPIPINDIWVAALARQHGLAIASRDKHFDVVSGIKRVEW